jgi:hypothetical protein
MAALIYEILGLSFIGTKKNNIPERIFHEWVFMPITPPNILFKGTVC